ncbi:MAG TPA: SDR family NAD(P)-dependent oxidoreductase [Pirellulales bacterium]|jgi:short-subunit dehydrogenase|nr:SDR family NAD(P)-dependent oxidoreductase [Pirellulales bacterium]
MNVWQGKVVVVTGGSSGLGKAVAEAFAQRGAQVVIAARRPDALAEVADSFRARGLEVAAVAADVTRAEDVERLFAKTIERFGRLDVLVNNAGRSMRRRIAETTAEDFRELFDLNVLGLVRSTQAALPHLLAQRGHLVNIGSLAGRSAARYIGAYPATKFAVTAYSQQLRLELGEQGLHVLLVCPGPIARDEPRQETPQPDEAGPDGLPASAYRPGAGVRTKLLSPTHLAAEIVRACETRRSELIRPRSARLLFVLQQISPRLGDWLVKRLT